MNLRKCETMESVNYDNVADGYNKRYETAYKQDGIASELLHLVHLTKAQKVLEVGCGTGHWMEILQDYTTVVGIDLSYGMLRKAAGSNKRKSLVRGDASKLPFADKTFDMVYCVNAVHHFLNPAAFITDANRVIKPDGVLAVIGMNPHAEKDRWFIYDYFPGTREVDLQRYPSPEIIENWMVSVGFGKIAHKTAERLHNDRNSDNVFPLSKDFTSQLSLLSEEDYERGIARIKAVLLEAKENDQNVIFPVDISLAMVTGWSMKRNSGKASS
ncbi:MAG: class I SAM-dependent methyltransferase [Deltaproteobacteria bacterium]|nr:class I SAM-dependent methyltransferase [Deltaproteobacteria bacterium]